MTKKYLVGSVANSTDRVKTNILRGALMMFIIACGMFHMNIAYGQDETAPVEEPKVEKPQVPTASDGGTYQVDSIDFSYATDHPQLPPIDEFKQDLSQLEIVLAKTDAGAYVAWRLGLEQERFTLGEFPAGTHHASSLRLVNQTVVAEFNRRGIIGVFVNPDGKQIDNTGKDIRGGSKALTMRIYATLVAGVRSVAAGERVEHDDRINSSLHANLVAGSPVRPPAEGDAERKDLLNKDELDRYVSFLNRHPGRRIDVAVSSGREPGTASLDYLVSENRPWLLYYQLSNTGTKQTDVWRHRFGYLNNQFTGNDDVLSFDYITSGFDSAHALVLNYEAPVSADGRIRARFGANYSEFTASDVGFANEKFKGDENGLNAELIANVYQNRDFFTDVIAGMRYQNITVDNVGLVGDETEDIFSLYLGTKFEEYSETQSIYGQLIFETTVSGVTDMTSGALSNLGRSKTDGDWQMLKFDFTKSVYLEPLLNRMAWEDTSTPESSTLAHELAFSFKGQAVLNENRVIPQHERTVGGVYSVRGYEESITAGDNVYIASLEYRYHVPRAFAIQSNPDETPLFGQPFRWAPQTVYGRPDWDLVLRTFVDYGRVDNNRKETFEGNHDMVGMGFGVDLLYKRNFNLRMDYAWAMKGIRSQSRELSGSGSSQFSLVATFIY